jgi:hypothetical protein
MLTTLVVTAVVIAFTIIAIVGHALLFSAVVFGRETVFPPGNAKDRELAASRRVQRT